MDQKIKKSYIFLDESGKPEVYSRKGVNLVEAGTASKFLVITALRTDNHLAVQQAVTGVIHSNYPSREVRTSHVSLGGLP